MKLLGSKSDDNINTFFSKLNYLPEIQKSVKTTASKFECILPFSLDKILLATFTAKGIYDDLSIKNARSFDYKTFEDVKEHFKETPEKLEKFFPRAQSGYVFSIQLPKPLNMRLLTNVCGYSYDKKNKIFYNVSKPLLNEEDWCKQIKTKVAIDNEGNEKLKKVYHMFSYSGAVLTQIDENKTLFSQVISILKFSISKSLLISSIYQMLQDGQIMKN